MRLGKLDVIIGDNALINFNPNCFLLQRKKSILNVVLQPILGYCIANKSFALFLPISKTFGDYILR